MSRLIFSADGHVREPHDLFTAGMPEALRQYGIRTERQGESAVVLAGDKVLYRIRLKPPTPEIGDFGRPNQKGLYDLSARLEDMKLDGVDAEILFPSAGLSTFLVENEDAELVSVQLYNDWMNSFVGNRMDTFVRCAILPVRNFDYTIQEMKRIAKLGFTAAMLPSHIPTGVPDYNDPRWDPVFEAAQNLRVVFVLHTATGLATVRPEKGPGGALINYTAQMCDAQRSVMYLVAGGVLDRFPNAKVALIESGASWLAALAERLDETYHGHQMFVHPKLSLTPREIIQRQVYASFQFDRACIMSRSVTGVKALMWGADYPHHEGTFPHSRNVVAHLFDDIDISESDKADIVGGNAARLFRLPRPEFAAAA